MKTVRRVLLNVAVVSVSVPMVIVGFLAECAIAGFVVGREIADGWANE